MMSLRGRIRGFHTCRKLWQSEPPAGNFQVIHNLSGRGKKLPPKKQDLVILNAKESRLFKKVPKQFQKSPGFFVLDPFELESSRKRLLEFKAQVPYEQVVSSVHFIKPTTTKVSVNRYKQIQDDIQDSYTLAQLRGYIEKYYPNTKSYKYLTKPKLVNKILESCWELEKSDEINSIQDLLIQRVFDISDTEMFILLTQNTIQQWLRANVQVILIPSEQQLVVRANGPHVQYIEIALGGVFRNVISEDIDLEQIQKLYSELGETLPLDEIQRLSAVYIQPKEKNEQNTDEIKKGIYTMSTLGRKRLVLAKRLMLWAINYNPSISTFIHSDLKNPALKWYKSYFTDSLPWTQKGKSWLRLKAPQELRLLDEAPKPTTLDIDTIYEELSTPLKKNTPVTDKEQSVTAVNFGHLLYDESTISDSTPKTIFQTELPNIRKQIMQLQPFNQVDDLEVDIVDRHEYHVQIKFVPSAFYDSEKYLQHSPIEFWMEIGEDRKADISTLQVLRIVNEQSSIVSLPNEVSDLKFIRSTSEPLIDPYNGSDDWLADQHGINFFLKKSVFDFSGRTGPKIADHVDIKIPGTEEVIRYDYVSLSHRKHLSLTYKDKLLQFAVVEGGALGGRTNELLLVGNVGDTTKDEFKEFADDSLEFVRKLR